MAMDRQPSAWIVSCGCIVQLLMYVQKVAALKPVRFCCFAVNQVHVVG